MSFVIFLDPVIKYNLLNIIGEVMSISGWTQSSLEMSQTTLYYTPTTDLQGYPLILWTGYPVINFQIVYRFNYWANLSKQKRGKWCRDICDFSLYLNYILRPNFFLSLREFETREMMPELFKLFPTADSCWAT